MKRMKKAFCLASALVLLFLCCFLIASEPPKTVFSLILAVLLHETGHVLAIKAARLPLRGILLLPFGAVLDTGTRLCSYLTECAVYLAGPLASFTGAALAVFGADAEKMNVSFYFCVLSLGLGCFNLLPLPGLDGAGAMRSLLAYLMPDIFAAERAARVVEAVFSVLFWLFAGVAWLAFGIGAYPLVLSVFFLTRLLADNGG